MNEDEFCARQVEMQQRDILADAPCDRLNYTAAHWIGIGDADGDSRDGEGDGGDGDDDDGDSDGGAGKGTRSIDTWVVAKVLGDRSDEWHDHRWRWWERKCGDESWWADFDIHFLACMPELDQLSPDRVLSENRPGTGGAQAARRLSPFGRRGTVRTKQVSGAREPPPHVSCSR